jgi:hypothetical protein
MTITASSTLRCFPSPSGASYTVRFRSFATYLRTRQSHTEKGRCHCLHSSPTFYLALAMQTKKRNIMEVVFAFRRKVSIDPEAM